MSNLINAIAGFFETLPDQLWHLAALVFTALVRAMTWAIVEVWAGSVGGALILVAVMAAATAVHGIYVTRKYQHTRD
jgi:hypothetical protein